MNKSNTILENGRLLASSKELAAMTVKDIAQNRKRKDDNFYAYKKEYSINKKRGWNVKYGGY